MNLFEVYNLNNLELVKGNGSFVWDSSGKRYLDLYGGHAVISIGHCHPLWVEKISNQIKNLGFYSNSVINPLQKELASLLGKVSDCDNYNLFMVNSGAEANENALKIASHFTGKSKVVAVEGAFHGRTSGALTCTNYPKMYTPFNESCLCTFIKKEDLEGLEMLLEKKDVAAFILEGIQGVGGGYIPSNKFLKEARNLCSKYGTLLIMDEVQSGFGRTGRFFAFQHSGIEPDLISMGKGMGNGFPVAGVLIHDRIKAQKGLLGTTYGGNHMACSASLAVLESIDNEGLMANSLKIGNYIKDELTKISKELDVFGRGLMVMVKSNKPIKPLWENLLNEFNIIAGTSANPNVLRILPPLTITENEVDLFIKSFRVTHIVLK